MMKSQLLTHALVSIENTTHTHMYVNEHMHSYRDDDHTYTTHAIWNLLIDFTWVRHIVNVKKLSSGYTTIHEVPICVCVCVRVCVRVCVCACA